MKIRLFLVLLFLYSCTPSHYTPKPKGYNRLDLPPPEYRSSPDSLPYSFDYSSHALIHPYSSVLSEKNWIEINYPTLHAQLHITYKGLNSKEEPRSDLLKSFLSDAYKLTSKQQIKAYAIDRYVVKTPNGITASIAEITGEVPTQLHFTMTDSVFHFIRGALYFNIPVHNDSLGPAIDYMKRETIHFINSLRWANSQPVL